MWLRVIHSVVVMVTCAVCSGKSHTNSDVVYMNERTNYYYYSGISQSWNAYANTIWTYVLYVYVCTKPKSLNYDHNCVVNMPFKLMQFTFIALKAKWLPLRHPSKGTTHITWLFTFFGIYFMQQASKNEKKRKIINKRQYR